MTKVWDGLRRTLHWLLVAGVAGAWWTSSDAATPWHLWAGYAIAALLGLRLLWGTLVGPRSARLSRCLRNAKRARRYASAWSRHAERRYLGHNPLGSLMVLALVGCALGACFTGWLFTTDRFWGYGWLAALHEGLAWTLLGLVGLHVAGVVVSSVRHRENLIGAMLTGRKARRTFLDENES